MEFLREKETATSLQQLLDAAFQHHYAIAAWKNTGREVINVVIDLSEQYKDPVDPELETLKPGFLVSPFLNESNHLAYLVKADVHFQGKNGHELNAIPRPDFQDDEAGERFLDKLPEKKQAVLPKYFNIDHDNLKDSTEKDFKDLIQLAIDRIRLGEIQKVVPSRRETIDLHEDFNLASAFMELTRQYPEAFISFFSIPDKGTWMGASPEILIEINEQGIFRTSAVAGTQLWHPEEDLSSVAWTQKEIEEQALVSRYIINNFKKIRLREFEEYGPKTIRAGNLVHLRTDFTVNIRDVNFPQLGTVMLKLLHPTSAVCGMPKDSSAEFLRKHENYDREFYSGYLGPVNIENRTGLYVNLRCARLLDKKAFLYSGAGITLDSNPEKEWHETLIKNQTMMEILRAGE
ncbi:MAG: chorismate-binding protein [Cyclobacteriaceae bacterium]|nr:chorismate-binding protein [Cyclobacteriaceae bacterium]